MNCISRILVGVLTTLLVMLASCATEPYYEAPPITPTNLSPVEDVNISVNASTTFTWLPTLNTQYYEFHIYNQMTKDTSQYSHIELLDESVCIEGRCSLTLNIDLPTSTGHAWRVRAGNNAGLSEWNRTRFNMIKASTESSTGPEAITEADTESGKGADLSTDTQVTVSEAVASEEASTSVAALENSDEIPSVELMPNVEEVAKAGDNVPAGSGTKAKPAVASNSSSESNGPDLIQPIEDKEVVTGSLVDFKWHPLPDAVSYDFFIYDSVSKEMVESLTEIAAGSLCQSENVCGLTREVALPEAHHSWRVRANFENSKSPFSSNRFAVAH